MKDEMIITIKVGALNDPDEMHIPLRPLFAGLAMCGLLAGDVERDLDYEETADIAFRHADAMLRRGEEEPQEEEVAE